jgi:hypothetical protein
MPTPEQFLTDSSLSEASYGPAKVARYQGKGRWQVFYAPSSGPRRPERPAMTRDVLAKQGASDLGRQRVNRILSEYPGG